MKRWMYASEAVLYHLRMLYDESQKSFSVETLGNILASDGPEEKFSTLTRLALEMLQRIANDDKEKDNVRRQASQSIRYIRGEERRPDGSEGHATIYGYNFPP